MDSHASRVGEVVGEKYRLVRLLGEGGMGSVYEARHDLIGRRFAVKFLHAELASHPEILARFRREAQAAGSLENENIAAVTDFGSSPDGAPYIVMEFLEGEDVAKTLARFGPMSVQRAAHILIQVCRGLFAAHGRGIVHRDLKPENLLLQQRGDGQDLVKILDFGIAKLKSSEGPQNQTRTGITLGTPYYMPPEQARGQKELDERADIYALGVILFELLSGRKPHDGENYNSILYSILMQAAPRIETFRSDLPPDLAAIVHKAMAADPNDRFQTVSELSQALAPYTGRSITPAPTIGHASTVMAPPVASQRSTSTRAPVALTPSMPYPTAASAPRSNAGLFVSLAALLLVGGGAAAWFFTRTPTVAQTAPSAATPVAAVAQPTLVPSLAPTPVAPPPEPPAAQATASASASAAPAAPPAAVAVRPAKGAKGAKPQEKTVVAPAPAAATPPPAARPVPAPRPAAKPDDDLFAP
jgi:serine/threonine-protein kinase